VLLPLWDILQDCTRSYTDNRLCDILPCSPDVLAYFERACIANWNGLHFIHVTPLAAICLAPREIHQNKANVPECHGLSRCAVKVTGNHQKINRTRVERIDINARRGKSWKVNEEAKSAKS
jgi:hypothetical protein